MRVMFLAAAVTAASLHEPQTTLQQEVKEANAGTEGSAFAQRLMRSKYPRCNFVCDFSKLWRSLGRWQCPVGPSPCAMADSWDTLPPSSVANDCPEVAAMNSADFSPTALTVPAGMNLIIYGHSYMKQIHETIMAANEESVVSTYYAIDGNTTVCAGASGGELAGPRCNTKTNCNTAFYTTSTLANGATVTAVTNYGTLQQAPNNDPAGHAAIAKNLTDFLRAGVPTSPDKPFTHALVMEPHGYDFFYPPPGATRDWVEDSYGCGWSDQLWEVWNREMPGKVRHLFPWGYNETDFALINPAAPKPALNLDVFSKTLPCHTDPEKMSMTIFRRAAHGIEGHLCIAAKDSSGYFLGPIPYMAQAAMNLLRPAEEER